MPFLGTIAIALALGACLFTILTGIRAGIRRDARWAAMSEQGVYLQTGLIWVASAALMYSFLTHDFTLPYVYGRSDARMPVWYVMASFWGGQEGSLLFWATVSAAFGGAATWINRDRLSTVMPFFHAVLSLTLLGLLVVLNFVASPFDVFQVIDAPVDGTGLNPLLQNPLMVIHPPCLLSGFATFSVPFSFGMAALLAGQTGPEWLKATRKWTLVSWLLLSVGNILGGMWAYRELGWGGYWAWDPVENAALIPWFTATALLHSVIIQEQRGMLRRWNAILVAMTYLLTILGTWMTRSGLIESVHTFAESEIGPWFFAILVGMTLFSVGVIAGRWKMLASESRMDSIVSREGAFLLNNWMLVGMAFVVLWGTLYPKFNEMVTGEQVSIGPTWFNQQLAPLGLVLLAMIGLGTLLPWRRTTLASVRKNFTQPVLVTALVAPAMMFGWWQWRGHILMDSPFTTAVAMAIIAWFLVVFNLATLVSEFIAGTRARARAGRGVLDAFMSLFARHRRRYGGYVVHIGMVLIFLAFIGNVVKADVDATLAPGQSVELGDYTIRFDGIETVERVDRVEKYANMTLMRNGRVIGDLQPARFDFNDRSNLRDGRPDPMKITSEIRIHSTPVEDLYIAFLQHDEERNAAAFKMVILPFTWWLWFGGVVLIAGTFICMWPDTAPTTTRRAAVAGGVEVASLLLTMLVPVLVFGADMKAFAQEPPEHGDEAPPADVIDPALRGHANNLYHQLMTTCEGCAGKTLATASPSCYPSNQDKARITGFLQEGMTEAQILDVFVEERGPTALAVPSGDGALGGLHWMGPVAGILGGIVIVGLVATRWRRDDVGSRPESAAAIAGAQASPAATALVDPYLARLRDELSARD